MQDDEDLIPPPVPPEADMRGLEFMPLDVNRLLDSDLFALSTGEEFKAAVALWCKCWTQMPASSLPDDDRVLAHLSGAGTRWRKVKAMALRGFVKCADGRLYHLLVAAKVADAWAMRQRQRARSTLGNAKRWGSSERSHGDAHDSPAGDPHGHPHGDPQRDRKGQGQCKEGSNSGSTKRNPLSVDEQPTPAKSLRNQYPKAFLELWDGYPVDRNMSKKEAYDVWRRLPEGERQAAQKSLPAFRGYCQDHPDYHPVHLCRYLSKRRAEGFLESAEKVAAAAKRVFVQQDTPQWFAWQDYLRKTRGRGSPVDKSGGWRFDSEWPPAVAEDVVH